MSENNLKTFFPMDSTQFRSCQLVTCWRIHVPTDLKLPTMTPFLTGPQVSSHRSLYILTSKSISMMLNTPTTNMTTINKKLHNLSLVGETNMLTLASYSNRTHPSSFLFRFRMNKGGERQCSKFNWFVLLNVFCFRVPISSWIRNVFQKVLDHLYVEMFHLYVEMFHSSKTCNLQC